MLFQDRKDAGRVLARMVAALPNLDDALVLGLPRGGVPVAFEVARAANLPLDILLVRKLGAPGQRELAMGAVASGGVVALNAEILRAFDVTEEGMRPAIQRELGEIERRERAYRGECEPLKIEGRTAILVDDGIATGASMRAAVQVVRPRASRVVIAIPVAAASTCRELESEADLILCAATPDPLEAVGLFYRNFQPTSDDEVRTLLTEARHFRQTQAAG
ncbi:MAG: phosphoribosyltransferase [Terracidiphilus sp.]